MIKDTANEIPSLSFPQIQRPFPHPSESSGLKRRIKLKRLVVSTWEDYSCTDMTRPLNPGPTQNPELWIENAVTYARLFPGLGELRLWEHSFVIIRDRDGIRAEWSEENFGLPFVRDSIITTNTRSCSLLRKRPNEAPRNRVEHSCPTTETRVAPKVPNDAGSGRRYPSRCFVALFHNPENSNRMHSGKPGQCSGLRSTLEGSFGPLEPAQMIWLPLVHIHSGARLTARKICPNLRSRFHEELGEKLNISAIVRIRASIAKSLATR